MPRVAKIHIARTRSLEHVARGRRNGEGWRRTAVVTVRGLIDKITRETFENS